MNTSLIKQVLEQAHVGHWQSFALLLFMGFFLLTLVWIYWPGSKPYYETIAQDLIKGDEKHG